MAMYTPVATDDCDLDAVPLRIGVRYSTPSIALDYRDFETGKVRLLQIPLIDCGIDVTPHSHAATMYESLVDQHPRFLSPSVMSRTQVTRLLQKLVDRARSNEVTAGAAFPSRPASPPETALPQEPDPLLELHRLVTAADSAASLPRVAVTPVTPVTRGARNWGRRTPLKSLDPNDDATPRRAKSLGAAVVTPVPVTPVPGPMPSGDAAAASTPRRPSRRTKSLSPDGTPSWPPAGAREAAARQGASDAESPRTRRRSKSHSPGVFLQQREKIPKIHCVRPEVATEPAGWSSWLALLSPLALRTRVHV